MPARPAIVLTGWLYVILLCGGGLCHDYYPCFRHCAIADAATEWAVAVLSVSRKIRMAAFATIKASFLFGWFGARVRAAAASDFAPELDVGSVRILYALSATLGLVCGFLHLIILSILWGGAG